MLMQSCWLEGRHKHLPVHMPAEGIKTFRQLLQTTYLFEKLLPFKLSLRPLKPGQTIRDGAIAVTPHPTTHLQSLKHDFGKRHDDAFKAFCFEVSVGKARRLGYSADLGKPSDLDPVVSRPLDVLVVELAHFTSTELFEYLQHKPIKKIVLTHLGRAYWKNPDVARLARRYFKPKQLIIAKDGLEVRF